jgi:hypothetical protein
MELAQVKNILTQHVKIVDNQLNFPKFQYQTLKFECLILKFEC